MATQVVEMEVEDAPVRAGQAGPLPRLVHREKTSTDNARLARESADEWYDFRLTGQEPAASLPPATAFPSSDREYSGGVAQLGERVNGIHEVRGSIPLASIRGRAGRAGRAAGARVAKLTAKRCGGNREPLG